MINGSDHERVGPTCTVSVWAPQMHPQGTGGKTRDFSSSSGGEKKARAFEATVRSFESFSFPRGKTLPSSSSRERRFHDLSLSFPLLRLWLPKAPWTRTPFSESWNPSPRTRYLPSFSDHFLTPPLFALNCFLSPDLMGKIADLYGVLQISPVLFLVSFRCVSIATPRIRHGRPLRTVSSSASTAPPFIGALAFTSASSGTLNYRFPQESSPLFFSSVLFPF